MVPAYKHTVVRGDTMTNLNFILPKQTLLAADFKHRGEYGTELK